MLIKRIINSPFNCYGLRDSFRQYLIKHSFPGIFCIVSVLKFNIRITLLRIEANIFYFTPGREVLINNANHVPHRC